ncbi:MAG: YeeE/YedE family protein [Rhodopirellula sp.]|nr:YeeE/YedE family protein [Rhodopirellula sp.]
MLPFPFSSTTAVLLTLLIGVCFGFVLERAGFGNARILAAQFYLHNMRVLKVMFTAIVTAMLLVFLSSSLGLMDFQRVWVPPTYFWPGIIGGLILGVGFIVGGYCPGTSLVAMSTLKIDGLWFVLGVLFGMLVFGQTAPVFWDFFNTSGFMGRLTIPELLGVDAGWVVLGVVAMAVGAFWAAEQAERIFSGGNPPDRPTPRGRVLRRAAVASAIGIAAVTLVIGQPGIERRIAWAEPSLNHRLEKREIFIDAAELLGLMHNNQIPKRLVDVRSETDFNVFHLLDAENLPPEKLDQAWTATVKPEDIVIVMSNDERLAAEAWKRLAVLPNINAYVLAGGLNRWLDIYQQGLANVPGPESPSAGGEETLRYRFPAALGDRYTFSRPTRDLIAERPFTTKVRTLKPVRAAGGGCG